MSELKNPGPIEFAAKIEREESVSNSSAWINFPLDLKETYGKGNLVPIIAIFDGKVRYQGSLAKMGGRDACLILRKDVRERLGKQPGDTVLVRIELDTTERKINLGKDEESALKNAGLLEMFRGLAFSYQREYHNWIEEAKRSETRTNRIGKMCEMLKDGKKEPR